MCRAIHLAAAWPAASGGGGGRPTAEKLDEESAARSASASEYSSGVERTNTLNSFKCTLFSARMAKVQILCSRNFVAQITALECRYTVLCTTTKYCTKVQVEYSVLERVPSVQVEYTRNETLAQAANRGFLHTARRVFSYTSSTVRCLHIIS